MGFARFVAERLADDVELGPDDDGVLERLGTQVQLADLYLAYGCALGDGTAIGLFTRAHHAILEGVSRRFVRAGLTPEDLQQQLLEKLFVSTPERPAKILEYRGMGQLAHWLRVTALRTFLNERRRVQGQARRNRDVEQDLIVLTRGADLELSFLKQRYRAEFKEAFTLAVAALPARERNLLWHKAVAGHNVDQIAAVYHLHRATAARQVARAREQLLGLTRAELMRRLRVDRGEFESIMNLIQSRLDVSLARMLADAGPGDPADKGGAQNG